MWSRTSTSCCWQDCNGYGRLRLDLHCLSEEEYVKSGSSIPRHTRKELQEEHWEQCMRTVTRPHCDREERETTQMLIKHRWPDCSLGTMAAQRCAGSLSASPTMLSGSKKNAVKAQAWWKQFNPMVILLRVCARAHAYAFVSEGWRTVCGESDLSFDCVGFEIKLRSSRFYSLSP